MRNTNVTIIPEQTEIKTTIKVIFPKPINRHTLVYIGKLLPCSEKIISSIGKDTEHIKSKKIVLPEDKVIKSAEIEIITRGNSVLAGRNEVKRIIEKVLRDVN